MTIYSYLFSPCSLYFSIAIKKEYKVIKQEFLHIKFPYQSANYNYFSYSQKQTPTFLLLTHQFPYLLMKQQNNQNQKSPLIHENIHLNTQNDQSQDDFNYQCFKEMVHVKTYRKDIQKKIEELNEKRNKIYQKVVIYEKKTQQEFKDYIRGEAPQRKKRNRRNADQIQREFNCPSCAKKYGSEGSMYQHIKLKHPNIYEPKKKGLKSQGSQSFQQESQQ